MTAESIVVGVDDAPPSLRAAALAWRIGEATGATCHLVHAVPDAAAISEFERASAVGPGLAERLEREAEKRLTARLRSSLPPAAARGLEVRRGRAAPVLAERAAHYHATLVVLGRKRHGPLERALGGSTAHYLVRALDIPILLGTKSSVKRVLAAIDVSPAAAPTLREARRLAKGLGADLRVLHVVSPIRYPRVVPRAPDRKLLERQAAEAFDRFAQQLGVAEAERTVRRGSPEIEIAAEAASWRADLVVVGSQGKGFVDRLLIGSTTEWLLDRLATVSLLVVPVGRRAGALPA